MARTRESLGIFWEGEEVDGFTIYGYWGIDDAPCPKVAVPSGMAHVTSSLQGPGWSVWLWDIRISAWPAGAQWQEFVEGLLGQVLKGGALVAWCGLEGLFAEPPLLFDLSTMRGAVWAASFSDQVLSPPGLDEEFCTLSDGQLSQLQRATIASG